MATVLPSRRGSRVSQAYDLMAKEARAEKKAAKAKPEPAPVKAGKKKPK